MGTSACPQGPAGATFATCLDSYCDHTGHCAAWVADGAPCDSTLNAGVILSVCGPNAFCDPFPDGGGTCIAGCGY